MTTIKEITYLANARIPTEKAHGVQIMKMGEAWARSGIKIRLILPWRFNKIKTDPLVFFGINQEVSGKFFITKIFSLDLIACRLPRIGFWVQSLSFALAAFFYLSFKKTELIYSRDFLPLWFLSFAKKELVFEVHNLPRRGWWSKRFLSRLKAIVAITEKIKGRLAAMGAPAEKIFVSPDGVDLEKFDIDLDRVVCRKKLGLPLEKKLVLYTGHLYSWKGAQILAEAAEHLSGGNCLVVFVGGTSSDVADFKKQNNSQKNILVLGHRPYDEIPYFLKAADILVLPNSGKSEISRFFTSPMKLFEYLAAGRPILASDLPAIREILNENNAIFFKPDNPDDLAQKIELILSDPSRFQTLARGD